MRIFPHLFICLFVYLFIGLFVPVQAQECSAEAIQGANNDSRLNTISTVCEKALQNMEAAVKPHRAELQKIDAAIVAFQARIKLIEVDVSKKTRAIIEGEKELESSLAIASRKIRQFYIRSYLHNQFALLFSSENVGSVLRNIGYQQAAVNEDKKSITQIALSVRDLEEKKKVLEGEKSLLAALKVDTDRRAVSIRKLVADAEAYESQLQGLIAQISARQQEFLGQKLAGLNIPRSAGLMGGCVDDRPIDPGFSPRLAVFSFGVPNRIGLNQWGAKGRAEAGQDAKTILSAYYNADYTTGYNQSINIHVVGKNEFGQNFDDNWNIEEYLKHLYEKPTNWDSKALQAQAIAARSYALAYTNNGSGSICPSQQCQVVKREYNAQSWIDAVNSTVGVVLTQGGSPIKAWFSSTHGGYVFASGDLQGWSSTSWTKRAIDAVSSINNFSDLMSSAYDRGSPWFYCDWGSRSQYNKTAWLKPEELADIVNVIILARQNSSSREHLYQPDKPNPAGTDTWDAGRVRSELGSRAFSNVSDMSVDWDRGSGMTTQVHISGDAGSQNFDGNEFRNFFNLRAPANIQIVGPLFNIEKR